MSMSDVSRKLNSSLMNGRNSRVLSGRRSILSRSRRVKVKTRHSTDIEHVGLAKRILDEARVELDNLLDGVEVGDGNSERLLDDEESDAFGAGRCREGAAVLLDVRGGERGNDVAEVDARGDFGAGAGFGDGGERGRERRDDGGGVAGGDFEHECDDGEAAFVVDALVHHVDFEGEVFVVDVVLRGRVHVELDEAVVGAGEAGCAVDDDFDCRSEVLEDYAGVGDVHDGSAAGSGDGGI